ncbi:Hypothetical predicted protein [Octopus vulgaris]|uniref:Uncharacterized protein n=1 Tax=Octopus vulgaris TaxID=6645 RepID=A0AA36BBP6_OCTVU|nr:Hypothetical predicted protein [Octopus vulgaris]
MANKSCHTQAIQVPLVNDKNEDNDMQTPTKQETGDPAEKDQTSHEKKQIQSKRSNEERPLLKYVSYSSYIINRTTGILQTQANSTNIHLCNSLMQLQLLDIVLMDNALPANSICC